MSIGFTINTQNFGLQVGAGGLPFVYACTYSYGQSTGAQQLTSEDVTRNRIFGLTTDRTRSGIMADTTSLSIPTKQLGKFIIRY